MSKRRNRQHHKDVDLTPDEIERRFQQALAEVKRSRKFTVDLIATSRKPWLMDRYATDPLGK